jgi:ABC-2 type transport system permease protein
MKRYCRLYLQFLKQYIKILIEYRADFIFGLVGFLLVQFSGVVFIQLIFQSIPALSGWTFYEVLFIYGFAQIPRGIDHVFTDNLWILSGRILIAGEFDKYLLRPINPLFHLLSERFQPDGFGEIIIGGILVFFSVVQLNLEVTFGKVVLFAIAVFFATIIYTAIKLAVSSISFWIKFAQSYLYMTYQMSTFTKYPMTIYPKVIRGLLTFIIPFAFTGYYPGAYFLGKVSLFRGIGMTIIISILSILVAYQIWLKGLTKYESSGS